MKKILIIVVLIALAFSYLNIYRHDHKLVAAQKRVASTITNPCVTNLSGKKVIVSISAQHIWACDGTTAAYNNPVVTGMETYPADLTPTGTYKIYAKLTNQTLKGCDTTGCWNDSVSYWLPFLSNQYGTYGFHDATWRTDTDFGGIDINAPYTAAEHGSHGCVEMPLAAAKWLYSWVAAGTTVNIQA